MPSAHSPALETLASEPSPIIADRLLRWTPEGPIPLADGDHEMPGVLRALGIVGARLREQARLAALGGADPSTRGAGVTSQGGAGVSSFH